MRAEIIVFANAMEQKMKSKDPEYGDSWKTMGLPELALKLRQEFREWEKSGYFPRLEAGNAAALYLAGLLDSKTTATYNDIVYTGSGIFTGANSASIWMFYNERDHEEDQACRLHSSSVEIPSLGVSILFPHSGRV